MPGEKKTSEERVQGESAVGDKAGGLQRKERVSLQEKETQLAFRKEALGILETRSFTALVYGMDAMLKSANVSFLRYEKLGDALVGICITGDISSVQVAIETGKQSLKEDESVQGIVIPNPHSSLVNIMESKKGIKGEIGI